ncbi:MAG: FHA domain-containing protein, partial [Deltaproteobacteria bacterium]|nr:FHA domain-containing protein [Deltaproteobacteria bacterium]
MPETRESVPPKTAREIGKTCAETTAADFANRYGDAFLLQRGSLAADQRPRWASFGTVSMASSVAAASLAPTSAEHVVYAVPRAGIAPFAQWVTVGRLPTSQLRINEESISKLHALLMFRNGGYVVSDGGSKNGTFVNEASVPRYDRGDPVAVKSG